MRRILMGVTGASAVSFGLAASATLQGALTPNAGGPLAVPTASCATRVLSDWADDGEVQGTYRLQCYRRALKALPEDLRAYSTAPDDLRRAMQSSGRS
jgi:hypothetical protein